jgi:mono/diheme cytochrome c family protein
MRAVIFAVTAIVLAVPPGARTQSAAKASDASHRYYSTAQATRGKEQYAQYCAQCHAANLAGIGTAPALQGDAFLHDYYSVGDLFSKVNVTMPGDNVHGLSTDTYLNVIAYLLQANGLPAGAQSLKDDVSAMKRMVLLEKGSTKSPATKADNAVSDGFYTEEQAARGEGFFRGSCSMCHAVEPAQPENRDLKAPPGRGFGGAGDKVRINLASNESIPARFRSVGSLFNKIRTSMPLYDAEGLSTEEYVDLTAYLLKGNGFRAGKEELKPDVNTMMGMTLPEQGFATLFNGKDFTGWGFLLGNGCTPRPAGCGQTEPGTTFKVEKGTVVCSGTPLGFMYTQKKYLNFTLRLEYRFAPYEGMESDDEFYGNSGYLIFMQELRVNPDMIEIQGMNLEILDVRPSRKSTIFTVDTEARRRAVRPVGQWNTVEIVSKDGQVHSYLNGTLVSTVSHHDYKDPGYIGFQSEDGKISWRNIRIKEE